MNNTDKLHNHDLIPDFNSASNLGRQEREVLMITGPQKKLDYPTEKMKMSNGCKVERYIIPEKGKQKVLDLLYPFTDKPSLDDGQLDFHTNRKF